MKPFTVAFPMPIAREDAPKFFLEKWNVDLSKKKVMFSGSPIFYTPILQGAADGLETIFAEHAPLSEDETKALANHQSLFFLEFVAKNPEEFHSFLLVAQKILEAGALGVYVENSGCAFSAKAFVELATGDVPMEAFVNIVEKSDSLYTLGLEPFGMPDLCTAQKESFSQDSCRTVLMTAAAAIFEDGAAFDSGAKWKDELGEFEFQKESKAPFVKGSPEWNALGYRRLILRSKPER